MSLHIDEEILREAMQHADGKTIEEVVNEALRAWIRRERVLELLKERGRAPWDGDIDVLRGRA